MNGQGVDLQMAGKKQLCACVVTTPDEHVRVALPTCLSCRGSGLRDTSRELILRRNANRRTPTAQEYFAFDGAHCRQIYARLSADWQCPACRRNKYQVLRWTLLFPNSASAHEGWAGGYHQHHDHGVESDMTPRFGPSVLCEQCNAADTSAKRKLKLPKQFSFSAMEIAQFVTATSHGWHLLDYDRAEQIYADVQAELGAAFWPQFSERK